MNELLFDFFGVHVTAWKLIGYLGVLVFGGRWVVQLWVSRKYGRPCLPKVFWIMSLTGSALLLCYFIFGKNDSVGVMSNLFPISVALYNLHLERRHARNSAAAPLADSRTEVQD